MSPAAEQAHTPLCPALRWQWQDTATAVLVALVGTVLVALLKVPAMQGSAVSADEVGGPPNYVIIMLVLQSMLFFSLSDSRAHDDDEV